jgi:hypothetical protein
LIKTTTNVRRLCSPFRANYEDCKAQAALGVIPSTKAQRLLFAQEWLQQAEAAEAAHRRKATISTALAK